MKVTLQVTVPAVCLKVGQGTVQSGEAIQTQAGQGIVTQAGQQIVAQ